MKIDHTTPLHAIAERMGSEATRADAAAMLELLLVGDYTDTDHIPQGAWLDLCERAVEGVARNAELLVGRRVEAGKGDDQDTGTVERVVRPGVVMVAWDSQVKTPADPSSLRLID